MKIKTFVPMFVLGGFLTLATFARATVVYDNLGVISYGADTIGSFGSLYDSFTSSGSPEAIISLDLLLNGPGGTGAITVGLFSDASTSPGALISTLGTIDDATVTAGTSIYSLSLINNPLLAANTRYWIGLSDTGSAKWSWSIDVTGAGVSGEDFANIKGVHPNTEGPYQMKLVTGRTAVPDSGSTACFLGLALAGVFLARNNLSKKRAK